MVSGTWSHCVLHPIWSDHPTPFPDVHFHSPTSISIPLTSISIPPRPLPFPHVQLFPCGTAKALQCSNRSATEPFDSNLRPTYQHVEKDSSGNMGTRLQIEIQRYYEEQAVEAWEDGDFVHAVHCYDEAEACIKKK